MKISSLFFVMISIFLVSIFLFEKKGEQCIVPSPRGDWTFEIARTREEHMLGLMNRENLCDRCGMLFVFNEEQPQTFWMKNTYIPLDIYFYNAKGLLVDVAQNMRPENETGTPMTYTSRPAKYVVEVTAGDNWKNDTLSDNCVEVGDN